MSHRHHQCHLVQRQMIAVSIECLFPHKCSHMSEKLNKKKCNLVYAIYGIFGQNNQYESSMEFVDTFFFKLMTFFRFWTVAVKKKKQI